MEEPFVIERTKKSDATVLQHLKALLMANRGARKVIIKIKSKDTTQVVNVPFGVDISAEMRQKIGEIAK